jgi:hypothetical protein
MTIAMTAEFKTARMTGGLVAGEASQDSEEACGELRERVVSHRRSFFFAPFAPALRKIGGSE